MERSEVVIMKIKRKLFMEPTKNKWESKAVLNPTAIKKKKTEYIFYRAVDKNWISSIGHAEVENNKLQRFDKPILFPQKKYEKKGLEDPRITKIKNKYYLLYTAFDGKDAQIAYATSKNLIDWEKQGIISPNIPIQKAREIVKIKKYRDTWKTHEIYGSKVCLWDKDAVLFPKKIKGKFIMLHRFMPDIQIVKFKDFSDLKENSFWEKYIEELSEGEDKIPLYRRYDWENKHIGAGATPIKTRYGWLLIYHSVEQTGTKPNPKTKRIPATYHASAALLNKRHPETEITRLKKPLFSPKYLWEKKGDVNNVVFPEGAIKDKKNLKIYYGCSDSRIGMATLNFKELLKKLISKK